METTALVEQWNRILDYSEHNDWYFQNGLAKCDRQNLVIMLSDM